MRAMNPGRGAVLLLVLALVLVAVAGCGGSDQAATASSAAATAASGQSADQIVKDSEAKMATVKSASFVADLGLQVQGDTAKMTDPTAKALLSQGITFHAEGASANDPTAVDMTMSLGIAGQNLEFGMKSEGKKSWLEYQGTWYALDAKNAKSLDEQAQTGAAPTEQLKSMGVDPSTWGTEYQLVGTEDLNGVQVYHVSATADPQKLADSLTKAAEDPALQSKLGGSSSELGQLSQGLTQNQKQAEELGKSPQGRHGGLLDRRRRPAHVQGAVRRLHGHVEAEGHAGCHRHDHEGRDDDGRLRPARRRDAADELEVVRGVHEPAVRRDDGRQRGLDALR